MYVPLNSRQVRGVATPFGESLHVNPQAPEIERLSGEYPVVFGIYKALKWIQMSLSSVKKGSSDNDILRRTSAVNS